MLANTSIRHNRKQLPKTLQAVRDSTGAAPALVAVSGVEQQASFVGSRILELRQDGVKLGQIGVLYRSHWQSIELQFELVRRDIPHVVRSGTRFFEQAHIKDVISYLRVLANPRDELAWKRVLKLIPNVGSRNAARIWEHIGSAADPLEAAVAPDLKMRGRAASGWREFVGLLWRLRAPDVGDSPSARIETVLMRGYEEYVGLNYQNAENRVEDLRQLARFASSFDSTESFLSELALVNTERFGVPRGTVGEEVAAGSDDDERVVLSTIHQAKGLEWRVVFVIWAVDGKFPSARSLKHPEAEEEERRLFYVAATRAKDELYVCYPVVQTGRGIRSIVQRPSRFITEIPRNLFEVWSVRDESFGPDPGVGAPLIN